MSRIRWMIVTLFVILSGIARADEPAEPKLGRYNVRSYGASNRPPLFLGHFVLEEGGKYKVHLPGGRLVGEGNVDGMRVKWECQKFAESATCWRRNGGVTLMQMVLYVTSVFHSMLQRRTSSRSSQACSTAAPKPA